MKQIIREDYEFVSFEKDNEDKIGFLLENISLIGYNPKWKIKDSDIIVTGESSSIKLTNLSDELIQDIKSKNSLYILSIETDELIPCEEVKKVD